MNFIGLIIFRAWVISLGISGVYTMPTDQEFETMSQCEAYVNSESIRPEIAESVKILKPDHEKIKLTNILCVSIESTPL